MHEVSSEKRLKIHLAAVFASNFSNYLYGVADGLLSGTGLSLKNLEHLMLETVQKAVSMPPKQAQTGPAIRNDQEVLRKHERLLEDSPELHRLYQQISELIITTNKT